MLRNHAIGLDLSLTSTGVAVGDETFIVSAKDIEGTERLLQIRTQLERLFNDHKVDAAKAIVAIEGYSFASRNSRAHALGELGGVVRLWLHEQGITHIIIAPTARAKFATGRGNASKSEVVSAISARTGLLWAGKGAEDRCDAWILQEMVLAHYGNSRYEWPALNCEALTKVEWPKEA